MKPFFVDTRKADALCREKFHLSEDVMMENAAISLESFICKNKKVQRVLVLCGGGNNGADGYALARRLSGTKEVHVLSLMPAKSEMCVLQKERASLCGVNTEDFSDLHDADFFNRFDCIVDCIFGSGFHGTLPENCARAVLLCNKSRAVLVSCDVPSGLDSGGSSCGEFFHAQSVVTMGALKLSLYADCEKDFLNKIIIAPLGVSEEKFSSCEKIDGFVLEETDLVLPMRKNQNVHKGSFGHAVVFAGEKVGASVIAGCAALKFGAGLVTLVGKTAGKKNSLCVDEEGFSSDEGAFSYELMYSDKMPEPFNALALGMGLGRKSRAMDEALELAKNRCDIPCVLDADVFYEEKLISVLQARSEKFLHDGKLLTVITPHPKEFSSLLSLCGLGEFSVPQIAVRRFDLAKEFTKKFPGIILVQKGANTFISCCAKKDDLSKTSVFINPLGSSSLAKAGSGDVLAGLTLSLLAQGEDALDASIHANLAHSLAGRIAENSFSLTPFGILRNVGRLPESFGAGGKMKRGSSK